MARSFRKYSLPCLASEAGGNSKNITETPTTTSPPPSSASTPLIGLRLTPSENEVEGETAPYAALHEAMQNAHNLLILEQAGKIKPPGC